MPYLNKYNISVYLQEIAINQIVISKSSDNGTPLIGGCALFKNFRYGESSFKKHVLEFEKLNYSAKDKLIKGKRVKLLDFEKNFYSFDSAILDFSKNKLIADNVNIDFNKGIFGNPLNDPRLKGNYFFSDGKKSTIKKGVFTSCKKMMIALLGKLKREKLVTIKKKRLSTIRMLGLKYTIHR